MIGRAAASAVPTSLTFFVTAARDRASKGGLERKRVVGDGAEPEPCKRRERLDDAAAHRVHAAVAAEIALRALCRTSRPSAYVLDDRGYVAFGDVCEAFRALRADTAARSCASLDPGPERVHKVLRRFQRSPERKTVPGRAAVTVTGGRISSSRMSPCDARSSSAKLMSGREKEMVLDRQDAVRLSQKSAQVQSARKAELHGRPSRDEARLERTPRVAHEQQMERMPQERAYRRPSLLRLGAGGS